MTLKLADNDNAVAQLTDIGDKSLVVASKELDVVASASIADDKFSSPSVSVSCKKILIIIITEKQYHSKNVISEWKGRKRSGN